MAAAVLTSHLSLEFVFVVRQQTILLRVLLTRYSYRRRNLQCSDALLTCYGSSYGPRGKKNLITSWQFS